MKMKWSALVALILALCTVLCMASCGKDEEEPEQPNVDSNTPTGEEYVSPGRIYEGEEIIVASYANAGTYTILQYNIAEKEEMGSPISQALVNRNLKVEEELGVSITLYPIDTSLGRNNTTKLQDAIRTGDRVFDFALPMGCGIGPMLQTRGMLVDLNTISTMDLTHSWWNQAANEEYDLYGSQYAAIGDICFFNLTAPIVTYFSKQLILDHELEDPYALAASGNWTYEKMTQMATQASISLDGNDTIDNADQFGFLGEIASLQYLLYGFGIKMTERDSAGNISIAINTEKTVNAVDKVMALFNQDDVTRIHLANAGENYGNFHTDYAIPKMLNKGALFYSFQLLAALDMQGMGAEFGIVPMPKYDVLQEKYYTVSNSWFSDHLIVPNSGLELDKVGHVIEAMGYYAQQYITPAVIEVSVTSRGVYDETSAQWIRTVLDNQVFDVAYIFNWGKNVSMFGTNIARKNENFTTAYASYENAILSEMEDTILDLTQ